MEITSEYRPDNWLELFENMSIDWIKQHAKFYLLSYEDTSSYALIWKAENTNERGWHGVRMKREYEHNLGYYMDFEPVYTDVSWKLETEKCNDITMNFYKALELANLHTI